MALPDPESLAKDGGPKCARNPELKKWLDDLKALKESGRILESKEKLTQIARDNGFDIGASSLCRHINGTCVCYASS